MNDNKVTIDLSKDEALVLFEFLSRCDDDKKQFDYIDHAEELVIWKLQASLENKLVEPLQTDYLKIIKNARNRLKKKL